MIKNNRAQALIAAIIIVVMLALFSVVGASLLGTQTGHSAIGLAESTQAFYLAHGGLEWYMQQIVGDNDWSDETAPAAQSLGAGTFEITLSNQAVDSIDVVSKGKVLGPDARYRERFVSATLNRAVLTEYAVFWDNDNGNLTFANGSGGTHVVGDMWSIGSASIGSNSEVTGTIYYASGESISGAGSYTAVELTPSPDIPAFDDTSYETLMSSWNTRIDNAGASVAGTARSEGSGTLNLSANVNWSSQVISYRTINTNGFDITGTNFTVNCRDFNLEDGSEIDSSAANFDINCTREFTMTDESQINSDNYTIDCRDFVMEDESQVDSQDNTITSNRDIILSDDSQIVNSETINTTDDFTMEDDSQISASNLTINCEDVFTMDDDSQITGDNLTINIDNDFDMISSSDINADNFSINIADNFNTNGTTSVSGYGYIVCSDSGNVMLHSETGDSGTFTATPTGGNIYFLSGDDMTVNSTQNDTDVVLNSGCYLYSRNPSGSDDLLRIRNEDTTIAGATIIAARRIIVEDGADITNSFLFVNYAGSNTNNLLQITGSSTTVGGSVISMGRANPSLLINSSAAITGLAYQYDGTGARGRTQMNGSSTITGALIAYEFDSNSFGPSTVTYSAASIPSPLPEGFSVSGIEVGEGTWDGL
jgi:hypothetical protein